MNEEITPGKKAETSGGITGHITHVENEIAVLAFYDSFNRYVDFIDVPFSKIKIIP